MAAVVLQAPRGAEVAHVFLTGDQHLGVQRRRHLDRVAQHHDEAGVRLVAEDVGHCDRGREIPDRSLADRGVRGGGAGEQALVGVERGDVRRVVGVEEVRFLGGGNEDARMLREPRRHRGGAAFRGTEDEEVRQTGGLPAGLEDGAHVHCHATRHVTAEGGRGVAGRCVPAMAGRPGGQPRHAGDGDAGDRRPRGADLDDGRAAGRVRKRHDARCGSRGFGCRRHRTRVGCRRGGGSAGGSDGPGACASSSRRRAGTLIVGSETRVIATASWRVDCRLRNSVIASGAKQPRTA